MKSDAGPDFSVHESIDREINALALAAAKSFGVEVSERGWVFMLTIFAPAAQDKTALAYVSNAEDGDMTRMFRLILAKLEGRPLN